MEKNIQYPQCFITNQIDDIQDDRLLCAAALTAWANVIAGCEPPVTFGETMAKIASKLGVLGTPETFNEWAKSILK